MVFSNIHRFFIGNSWSTAVAAELGEAWMESRIRPKTLEKSGALIPKCHRCWEEMLTAGIDGLEVLKDDMSCIVLISSKVLLKRGFCPSVSSDVSSTMMEYDGGKDQNHRIKIRHLDA